MHPLLSCEHSQFCLTPSSCPSLSLYPSHSQQAWVYISGIDQIFQAHVDGANLHKSGLFWSVHAELLRLLVRNRNIERETAACNFYSYISMQKSLSLCLEWKSVTTFFSIKIPIISSFSFRVPTQYDTNEIFLKKPPPLGSRRELNVFLKRHHLVTPPLACLWSDALTVSFVFSHDMQAGLLAWQHHIAMVTGKPGIRFFWKFGCTSCDLVIGPTSYKVYAANEGVFLSNLKEWTDVPIIYTT